VKLLLDTHVLLWAMAEPELLPADVRTMLEDLEYEPVFSAASIWEVAIKSGLERSDFRVDPRLLRRNLLDSGYTELAISSEHAVGIRMLPPIHQDPFDRILIAQSIAEGITLLTLDPVVARYPAPVRLLGGSERG
jgi:PIN domain nuclease of toxin-antitoxin system